MDTTHSLVMIEAYTLREGEGPKDEHSRTIREGRSVNIMSIGTWPDAYYSNAIEVEILETGIGEFLDHFWEYIKPLLPEAEPGQWARVVTLWETRSWKDPDDWTGPGDYHVDHDLLGQIDMGALSCALMERGDMAQSE